MTTEGHAAGAARFYRSAIHLPTMTRKHCGRVGTYHADQFQRSSDLPPSLFFFCVICVIYGFKNACLRFEIYRN